MEKSLGIVSSDLKASSYKNKSRYKDYSGSSNSGSSYDDEPKQQETLPYKRVISIVTNTPSSRLLRRVTIYKTNKKRCLEVASRMPLVLGSNAPSQNQDDFSEGLQKAKSTMQLVGHHANFSSKLDCHLSISKVVSWVNSKEESSTQHPILKKSASFPHTKNLLDLKKLEKKKKLP